jgi:queuosine precursor transporter
MTQTAQHRTYRYYDFIVVAFVTVLLCSNLIGAAKAAQMELPFFGTVVFGAGVLFFPISYLFGDILTEVYGYAHDRRAVWCGFGAIVFAAFMSMVVISMPTAPGDFNSALQGGLEIVFGNTWRIVLGSILAFWSGSLVNSYVLAKLKIFTQGRHLWVRTIGSTAVGELVDSGLFYVIAFYGIWPNEQVVHVAVAQYFLKTGWEVVATPLTYWVVAWLKRKEQEDHFDYHTNFTPFKLKV